MQKYIKQRHGMTFVAESHFRDCRSIWWRDINNGEHGAPYSQYYQIAYIQNDLYFAAVICSSVLYVRVHFSPLSYRR